MKIHSFVFDFLLFIIIFCFFVIIPTVSVFFPVENETVFINWNLSVFGLLQLALCIFLLIIYNEKKESNLSKTQYFLYKIVLPSTFVLSILFFVSLIFKYISVKNSNFSESTEVMLPQNLFTWFTCILTFGIGALFEEVIYRYYLIEGFLNFFKKKNLILIIIVEIIACCLFAIGHLYMGYLSVLNALIAHIILRLCYKLTGNIYSGFIAHFVYNVISLILL